MRHPGGRVVCDGAKTVQILVNPKVALFFVNEMIELHGKYNMHDPYGEQWPQKDRKVNLELVPRSGHVLDPGQRHRALVEVPQVCIESEIDGLCPSKVKTRRLRRKSVDVDVYVQPARCARVTPVQTGKGGDCRTSRHRPFVQGTGMQMTLHGSQRIVRNIPGEQWPDIFVGQVPYAACDRCDDCLRRLRRLRRRTLAILTHCRCVACQQDVQIPLVGCKRAVHEHLVMHQLPSISRRPQNDPEVI